MAAEFLRSRVPGMEGQASAAIAGDFAFLRVQLGWDDDGEIISPGYFSAQFERSFENLAGVLEELGGSLSSVVRVRYPFVDARNYRECRRIRHRTWPEEAPPAASVVIGTGLDNPQALGGVEAIAYLGNDSEAIPWDEPFTNGQAPPDHLPEDRGKIGFSPAIRADGFVFLAGQVALDRNEYYLALGDPAGQTRFTQENNLHILRQVGLPESSVIRIFNFVTYPQYADTVTTITNQIFGHQPPSNTIVATLGWPGNIIESELIAHVGSDADFQTPEPFVSDIGTASSVVVDHLLFTAGIVARDAAGNLIGPGDGQAQIQKVLENLTLILTKGGTAVRNLVSVNVYVSATTLVRYWEEAFAVFWRTSGRSEAPLPPMSILAVPALPSFEHLIQVEAIATVE